MKKATICFLLNYHSLLLAKKKYGFGEDKLLGYGGKYQVPETPEQATVREVQEESTLIIKEQDLEQVAILYVYSNNHLIFECYVYFIHSWEGTAKETAEMYAPEWHSISNLPYDKMPAGDKKWLSLILNGKKIIAHLNRNDDQTFTFAHKEVDQFS